MGSRQATPAPAGRARSVYERPVATTSPTTDRVLPALTPSVLTLLLTSAVVLSLAGRTYETAGGAAAWWGAWVVAAGIALLGSFRSALPAVPVRGVGVLWLLAGALGGALLGRHALLALMAAWVDFPADHPGLPGLGQGDLALLVALLLPTVSVALASRLRSPRPALLVPALLRLAPVLVLLVPAVASGFSAPKAPPEPAAGMPALLVMAGLLWATVLPGSGTLPLSTRRPVMHHWMPRLLTVGVLVGLPTLLLAYSGEDLRRTGGVPLAQPGRRLFGYWGGEVGAGMECAVLLVAAGVLLVLCARIAARSLPRLRSGIFPALALAAGLCAAWLPPTALLAGAALTGWLAVLWGIEPDGIAPPPLLEVGDDR